MTGACHGGAMDSDQLGRRIRQLRMQRGLTQAELAEKLNVSFQQIQKYERGRTSISLMRLQAIARALSVPTSDFLREEGSIRLSDPPASYDAEKTTLHRLTREEAAMVKHLRKITNRKVREGLLRVLKGIAEGDSST